MRELDARDTGADHHEVLGDLGRRVRLARREDPLAVDARPLGHARTRAGGEKDRVGFDLLDALFGGRLDRVRAEQAAGAADETHALRLEQAGDALTQRLLHAGDARAQRGHVEPAVGFEPHRGGAAELGELVAGRDHRLARDAVPEVRGAADHVALHERDLRAERRGDGRGGVPAGATTDDHETHGHDARLRAATPIPLHACRSCGPTTSPARA